MVFGPLRNSRPEVLLEKGVLKICSKFTREHPCRSAISIKLQSNFIDLILHDNINVRRHLNKGKLHLNDTGISRFVRNFRDFLNLFETTWHESTHNLLNVSSPSSLSGYPSLSTIDNDLWKIQQQRIIYSKNIIIGHLDINSIRNKFDTLDNIVKAFDIFLISESKLDNTFLINQFAIGGYKVFRRDRKRFEGGLILYINENIPLNLVVTILCSLI